MKKIKILYVYVIILVTCSIIMADMPSPSCPTVNIQVDRSIEVGPFTDLDRACDPHWINWFEVEEYKSIFPLIRADGFEIARIMGTMSVTQMYTENTPADANGQPIYDYTYLDKWLDPIVKAQLKPMLIMNCIPNPLSQNPSPAQDSILKPLPGPNDAPYDPAGTGLKNKCGCKNYQGWENLISSMLIHLQNRYGTESLSKWLCETWNEGDYGDFGCYQFKSNFLEFQDHTVNAIKRVDQRIRVGGPGSVTSTYRRGGESSLNRTVEEAPDWYDIVRHIAIGTNYVTGKKGTPLDFITSHMYDLKGQIQATDSAKDIFTWMIATVAGYSELKNKPIVVSEWYGTAEPPPYDVTYSAARQLRTMVLARNIGLKGMVHHQMTSWPWLPNKLFSGNYPILYTLQGIRTQQGSMLSLYNKLNGMQVLTKSDYEPLGGISSGDSNELKVLVYHCEDSNGLKNSKNVKISIHWPRAASKKIIVKQHFIDEHRGNARILWEAMGSPLKADKNQLAQLKAAARIPFNEFTAYADEKGDVVLCTTMTMPAVQMFELNI